MRVWPVLAAYEPTPAEEAELLKLFAGEATIEDCPALCRRVGGGPAKLEQAVRNAAACGRVNVLDNPKMPNRPPYYAAQYLAAFGEVLEFTDETAWGRQCENVMGLKKFYLDTSNGRYKEDRVVLLKRAAIWCGNTSEQFTRNHKQHMFQALMLWLDMVHPASPEESKTPKWLVSVGVIAMAVVLYLATGKVAALHLPAWQAAWFLY